MQSISELQEERDQYKNMFDKMLLVEAELRKGLTWTPAATLPESGRRVLIVWENDNGKQRTSLGFYAAEYSVIDQNEDDQTCGLTDYNPENGEHYFPEGWYEIPSEVEYYGRLSGVTHWKEIPTLPNK